MAGVDRVVLLVRSEVKMSYELHQKKKKVRKMSVADNP